MFVQIKQGGHASKFQQTDWRTGRKGGVAADVDIGANPDARDSAFTDVRVATSEDSTITNAAAPTQLLASGGDTEASVATGDKATSAAGDNGKPPVNTNGGSNNIVSNGAKGAVPGGVGSGASETAKENKVENSAAWSKEQEMALLKALKAISKDVSDRYASHQSCEYRVLVLGSIHEPKFGCSGYLLMVLEHEAQYLWVMSNCSVYVPAPLGTST